MKVISISTDRNLFQEGSAVLLRSLDYASEMEEMHIVVFSLKNNNYAPEKIRNLFIYPTNSTNKINYIFDANRIGKKIISESGANVISTQDPFETGLVGFFLKNKFNIPLQIQIHTDFLSPYFKDSPINYFRVILAKFLIPKANRLRIVSSAISESINSNFSKLKPNIDILPIFVDPEKYKVSDKTNFPQFDQVIFMASRLSKEKKIDIALKAMKEVVLRFPRAGLVIAGKGQEKENLEKLTKQYGLLNNVLFLDWHNNLVPIYKAAQVFLLTSIYEGYAMTLIEAASSGTPIVTTKVGVAKTELFKDGYNSYVCSVGDVSSLSGAILKLISDPEKRELFKQRMQDSIKSILISREEYTKRYVNLLEKLLKN